jgi:hypothetical protein
MLTLTINERLAPLHVGRADGVDQNDVTGTPDRLHDLAVDRRGRL